MASRYLDMITETEFRNYDFRSELADCCDRETCLLLSQTNTSGRCMRTECLEEFVGLRTEVAGEWRQFRIDELFHL